MKRIQLLSTSYDDVIAMLGKPIDGTTEKEPSEYFDLDGGRLWVGFSSARCEEGREGYLEEWDVPKFTVIGISFRPHHRTMPRRLKISLRDFEKTAIDDVPGAWIYRNESAGVEYSTHPDGTIDEFEFFPSKQFNNYKCKRSRDN